MTKFNLACTRLRAIPLIAALTAIGCAGPAAAPSGAPVTGLSRSAGGAPQSLRAPVPCSKIANLRSLGKVLSYVSNPKTGDSIEYVVIGDGAVSNDLLVMFPGTGQILPGWPAQLITNSTYSPKIVHTLGYRKSQDGTVSLCHNYRLVLFDYPGVGKGVANGNVTRDAIASDVDAMLQKIGKTYGISTSVVDPVGWSLGTTDALKYAFLSPASRPSRTIHNVILIAGGPGGNTNGQAGMDSAACQATMFSALLQGATGQLAKNLKLDLSKLIFPYRNQGPRNNGTKSGCTATISGSNVTLSVQLQCSLSNACVPFLENSILDLLAYPWKSTQGVDSSVFIQQREQANDWSVARCTRAAANFTSAGCTSYGAVQESATNGGVCATDAKNTDEPIARACAPLTMTGKITVINGHEDLFIQWTYGRALVAGYDALGAGKAKLVTYPGSAGHGVMIQHPKWTQMQIQAAMQGS
jgi:pimeloyl-ACP methyl ester carboxylesterase